MAAVDVPIRALKRVVRALSRWPAHEVLARVFDPGADELVVRVSERGAPLYKEAGDAAKWTRAVADSDNDAAPSAAPAAGLWNFEAFGSMVLHWVAGTATDTTFTIRVWVWSDLGTWLLINTTTGVAAGREILVPGVGYRIAYAAVSDGAGGLPGTLTLNAAGV